MRRSSRLPRDDKRLRFERIDAWLDEMVVEVAEKGICHPACVWENVLGTLLQSRNYMWMGFYVTNHLENAAAGRDRASRILAGTWLLLWVTVLGVSVFTILYVVTPNYNDRISASLAKDSSIE